MLINQINMKQQFMNSMKIPYYNGNRDELVHILNQVIYFKLLKNFCLFFRSETKTDLLK